MKVNYAACAICDSSWGDLWVEVERTRLFFCCEICAHQLQNLVDRIKLETGWTSIDSLTIAGNRRGRSCRATLDHDTYACQVAFNAQGRIRAFRTEPPSSHPRGDSTTGRLA